MITNERQYRITRAWAEKFAEGADHVDETGAGLEPEMRRLYKDAYESQVQELREQLVVCQGCNGQFVRAYWERRLPAGRRSRASGSMIADSVGATAAGWKPALPVDPTAGCRHSQ